MYEEDSRVPNCLPVGYISLIEGFHLEFFPNPACFVHSHYVLGPCEVGCHLTLNLEVPEKTIIQ